MSSCRLSLLFLTSATVLLLSCGVARPSDFAPGWVEAQGPVSEAPKPSPASAPDSRRAEATLLVDEALAIDADPDDRLKRLKAAAHAYADVDVPHYWLGVELLERGDLVASERELKRAVELAPANLEARARLGMVLIRSGQSGAAVSTLEAADSLAVQQNAGQLRLSAIQPSLELARTLCAAEESAGLDGSGATPTARRAPVDGPKPSDEIRDALLAALHDISPIDSRMLLVKGAVALADLCGDSLHPNDNLARRTPVQRLCFDLIYYAYRNDPGKPVVLIAALQGWRPFLSEAEASVLSDRILGALNGERLLPSRANRRQTAANQEPPPPKATVHSANGTWRASGPEMAKPMTFELRIEGEKILVDGKPWSAVARNPAAKLIDHRVDDRDSYGNRIALVFAADWKSARYTINGNRLMADWVRLR